MSLIGPRLKAVIVKEVWALLRDPKVRLSLVLPPPALMMTSGARSVAIATASSRSSTGEWGITPENRPAQRSPKAS